MKKELAEKSAKLLEEINELNKVDKLLKDSEHKHVVNFVVKQHFGDTYTHDYERVQIGKRHTPRFIKVLHDVIKELENELEAI